MFGFSFFLSFLFFFSSYCDFDSWNKLSVLCLLFFVFCFLWSRRLLFSEIFPSFLWVDIRRYAAVRVNPSQAKLLTKHCVNPEARVTPSITSRPIPIPGARPRDVSILSSFLREEGPQGVDRAYKIMTSTEADGITSVGRRGLKPELVVRCAYMSNGRCATFHIQTASTANFGCETFADMLLSRTPPARPKSSSAGAMSPAAGPR